MVENLNIPILSAVARVRPLLFKILHNEIVSSKVLLIGSYVAMTNKQEKGKMFTKSHSNVALLFFYHVNVPLMETL